MHHAVRVVDQSDMDAREAPAVELHLHAVPALFN